MVAGAENALTLQQAATTIIATKLLIRIAQDPQKAVNE
jgi:hypothetical protein